MKKIICTLCLITTFNNFAFASASDTQVSAEDKILINELNQTAKDFANKRTSINTSIDLGGKIDDSKLDNNSLEFLKNFKNCKEYKGTSKSLNGVGESEKEILGLNDNICKTKEILKNGKEITCNFPKSFLPEISIHYKKVLSGSFTGKYNVDFDMKMPEIDFSNFSKDNLDFNFKMEMPKLKIDKEKSTAEKLIEEFCK